MIDDHFINEFGTESKKKNYTGNQQSTEMFYTMKYSHYEIFPNWNLITNIEMKLFTPLNIPFIKKIWFKVYMNIPGYSIFDEDVKRCYN